MAVPHRNWLDKVRGQGFFLLKEDMPHAIAADRLHQVLIRCNACRLVVAVQYVAHVIDLIETSRKDWVRDVSLLAGDPWIQAAELAPRSAPPSPYAPPARPRYSAEFSAEECGGSFDGFAVSSDCDPGL